MKLQGQYRNNASSKLIGVLLATALLAAPALAQTQPAVSGASKEFQPLTPAQKFGEFARTTYDPLVWTTAAFDAGIGQATHFPEHYGQGAEGYGKRFGAAMADQASAAFFGRFLLPTALRQDPRYFRRGSGSFGSRLGYVISRVFVTRTDSGGRAFNASIVGGALASGALSNVYYPEQDRGAGLTLTNSAFNLAGAAATNLRPEFWPDVKRKLSHKNASAGE